MTSKSYGSVGKLAVVAGGILASLAIGACDAPTTGQVATQQGAGQLGSTTGAQQGPAEMDWDGTSLWDAESSCVTASWGVTGAETRGGVFTVVSVGSATTDDIQGGRQAVELRMEHAWGSALPQVLTRGLPSIVFNDGEWSKLTKVSAGDRIGLILPLAGPFEATCGSACVFRRGEHGGYTNGLLFTQTPWSLEQIGDLFAGHFKQLSAGEWCDPEVRADYKLGYATQPAGEGANYAYPGPPAQPLPNDFDPDAPPSE